VERTALLVIAFIVFVFVVDHEIEPGAFPQIQRLVDDETTLECP
jgi:hypothetical protein